MSIAPRVRERFRALDSLVGNTPMLALRFRWRGQEHRIFAKAEFLNLTGSIKDRMALHMLRNAYDEDLIDGGEKIVEASSGNTGISLAAIGSALGHPVEIFMPDWMSQERVTLIRSFGAQVRLVGKEQGGFLGSIAFCENIALHRDDVFLPRQFSNDANVEAHRLSTGPEIVAQLAPLGLEVNAFVAGVGTGGTVMGVGRHLKSRRAGVCLHPIEPIESPTLSTGVKKGAHRIQGISDEFVPAICQLKQLDSILAVSDGDAILMAQKLASELGLGVGVSSGANFLGALQALDRWGGHATVVTVFCDDNKKYLSTDLVREEPVAESYRSPLVELLDYETLPRAF